MRIAVLSDIHSNLAALEAVQNDLPAIDEVWALGDIVGYGPQPNEVIRSLQAMGARSVLGNHDGAAIGTVDPRDFNPDAAQAIAWTAEVIDDNARTYLATLPEVRRDGELTAVHGSPRDPVWEYIVSASVAAENLAAFETRLCLIPICRSSSARLMAPLRPFRPCLTSRSPSMASVASSTRAVLGSRATAIRPRHTCSWIRRAAASSSAGSPIRSS